LRKLHKLPILNLQSPEKRCGKTLLLSLIAKLVKRPLPSSNISGPSIFRVIEEYSPTLLIDEADAFLNNNEEARGLVDSSLPHRVAEIFLSSHRPGSETEAIARDAAIITSLALQHGCDLAMIAHGVTRADDGSAATAIGAAFNLLAVADLEVAP